MASTPVVMAMACAMAMLVLGVVASADPQAECGRQAYDALCLFNACCSKDGQCGRSASECGAGCQSGPCVEQLQVTEAECGSEAYDAQCWPRSMCCSASGKCGAGREFCGAGCQNGACYDSPMNLDKSSTV